MKTLLSLFLVLASLAGLPAQTILLKSGQSAPADNFTRDGDMLTVSFTTSSGGTGKIAYHISDIDTFQLPAPVALTDAAQSLARGQGAEALEKIQPVADLQKTIRDIPGNWWTKTALVESSALAAVKRTAEAEALLNDVMGFSKDADIQMEAKLQMALLTPPKDPAAALAAYDAIIAHGTEAKTLTQAWIAEGDLHYAQHEYDDALMAYLTVPIFYSDNNPLVPKALWGAAQSYARIKDSQNQEMTLNELITKYPDTPEASLAKAELQKEEQKKEENKS